MARVSHCHLTFDLVGFRSNRMSAQSKCCLGLSALADTWAMWLHQGACGRRQGSLGDISKQKKASARHGLLHVHVSMCEAGVARHVRGISVKALSLGAKVSMLA